MSADDDGTDGASQRDAPGGAETQTWPELAVNLYERLTGRGAEITYDFEDLEVDVPSRVGDDPQYAHWRVNGSVSVRTRDADGESTWGDEGNGRPK